MSHLWVLILRNASATRQRSIVRESEITHRHAWTQSKGFWDRPKDALRKSISVGYRRESLLPNYINQIRNIYRPVLFRCNSTSTFIRACALRHETFQSDMNLRKHSITISRLSSFFSVHSYWRRIRLWGNGWFADSSIAGNMVILDGELLHLKTHRKGVPAYLWSCSFFFHKYWIRHLSLRLASNLEPLIWLSHLNC